MSRGAGRLQREVLTQIAIRDATATEPNGTGPVGVMEETLLVTLFGQAPSRSQRDSFHRAVRRLQAAGALNTYSRAVRASGNIAAGQRRSRRRPVILTACTGDEDCRPQQVAAGEGGEGGGCRLSTCASSAAPISEAL